MIKHGVLGFAKTSAPRASFLISQIKQGAKLLSWFPFFDISHKVLHTESCSHVLKNSPIVLLMESDAFFLSRK